MADPMTFHDYLFCPQTPLVFGDGKPLDFGLGGGSLPFPFPPTLAGAVRAAAETAANRSADPFASVAKIGLSALARVAVNDADSCELLFRPAADAIYFDDPTRSVRALRPEPAPTDAYTDLEDEKDKHRSGASSLELLSCINAPSDAGKPAKSPAYWTALELQEWLSRSAAVDEHRVPVGDHGPAASPRNHVTIQPTTKGSAAGQLFRSTGNDFAARLAVNLDAVPQKRPSTPPPGGGSTIGARVDYRAAASTSQRATPLQDTSVTSHRDGAFRHEYAIALRTNTSSLDIVRRVGGEGRFALITPAPSASRFALPKIPDSIKSAASSDVPIRIRFVLVTPALFENGWAPTTAEGTDTFQCGLQTCRIIAAALPRAQAFSGWGPSGPGLPTRVVPAGTVYWIEVTSGDPRALHGESLCAKDHANDGWGYGFVGVP